LYDLGVRVAEARRTRNGGIRIAGTADDMKRKYNRAWVGGKYNQLHNVLVWAQWYG
jgi:hypothetical protein